VPATISATHHAVAAQYVNNWGMSSRHIVPEPNSQLRNKDAYYKSEHSLSQLLVGRARSGAWPRHAGRSTDYRNWMGRDLFPTMGRVYRRTCSSLPVGTPTAACVPTTGVRTWDQSNGQRPTRHTPTGRRLAWHHTLSESGPSQPRCVRNLWQQDGR